MILRRAGGGGGGGVCEARAARSRTRAGGKGRGGGGGPPPRCPLHPPTHALLCYFPRGNVAVREEDEDFFVHVALLERGKGHRAPVHHVAAVLFRKRLGPHAQHVVRDHVAALAQHRAHRLQDAVQAGGGGAQHDPGAASLHRGRGGKEGRKKGGRAGRGPTNIEEGARLSFPLALGKEREGGERSGAYARVVARSNPHQKNIKQQFFQAGHFSTRLARLPCQRNPRRT